MWRDRERVMGTDVFSVDEAPLSFLRPDMSRAMGAMMAPARRAIL